MADPNAVSQVIVRGAQGARAAQAEHGGSAFDVWTRTGEGHAGAARQTATLNTMPDAPVESGTSVGALPKAMGQQVDALKQAAADVGKAKGALATAGAVMGTLTALEQAISTPLSAIPFPAFPAVRVLDMDLGLPHAHNHPPNLIPPAPPVPLPSTGPVIPIPYVSGAATVLINGMPAGRCGDMGMGIWCGGYFPMFEIFLGSSSVWIEGMRAARLGVDITKHCIFSHPKPNDPPMGPMVGMTISSSANVVIGGIPMPSLTNMAIGAAMKVAFKGVAKIVGLVRKGGAKVFERAITRSSPAFNRSSALKFSQLTGGAKRLVRELEAAGHVGGGAGVRLADVRLASEFLGLEVGVLQSKKSGALRVVLGTENGISKGIRRPDEVFLVHTHPVQQTIPSHLNLDIKHGTKEVEAVVDWGDNVTYYNKDGIIPPPPPTSPINDHGFIVGYPR